MTSYSVIVLFVLYCSMVCGFKFSENFQVCHQKDSKLDSCLKEAIEKGFRIIGAKGISSINIPSIEPVLIEEISFGSGSKAVQLDQTYYDVKAYGFSNATVEQAHYDPGKKILSYTSRHPFLKQVGRYDLKGNILVIPVYGKGDSIITLKGVSIKHTVHLDEEKKNGKTYLKVTGYDAYLTVTGAHFDFKNLFDGDKRLSENILKVTNDNWDIIIDELRDGINKSYGKVFESIAQKIFSSTSVDDIFPS